MSLIVPSKYNSHVVAIRTNGTLWVWGENRNGQLGDSTYTYTTSVSRSISPKQIGTSSWTTIATGKYHTAAIRGDGALFTWGLNTNGAIAFAVLGTNSLTNYNSPIQIGTSSWTAVAADDLNTIAIRSDGALFIWGSNSSAQLGNGDSAFATQSSPIQIGTSSWTTVAAGSYLASYAIRSDGALFAWGANSVGQLGIGTVSAFSSSPTAIGTSSWSAVSTGVSHVMALRSNGSLFTWGLNTNGQIGDATVAARSSPVQIGTSSWIAIKAGGSFSMALRSDYTLWAWGNNTYGQLGNSVVANASSPIQVGTSSWITIGAGIDYAFGVGYTDSFLYAWGNNNNIGVTLNGGSFTATALAAASSPTQVGSVSYATVAIGDQHTAAIANGTLYTWGNNNNNQLGNTVINAAPTFINYSSPVQVGTGSWGTVNTYYKGSQALAIDSSNKLQVWGNNTAGQTGTGDITNRSSPVQVGTSSWTVTSTGLSHTIALRADGALFTWGNNNFGQLGSSNLLPSLTPLQIGTSSWTAIAAGDYHSVARDINGGLWVWGYNTTGQLGTGDLVKRISPLQLGTSSWTAVAAGQYNTYAIRSDGALFTWGANALGQLGAGTIANRSSPVQVGTSSWSAVKATTSNVVAIRSDGGLFTWGGNVAGQLGNNNVVYTGAANISSPVQVTSGVFSISLWNTVNTYGGDSMGFNAIDTNGYLWAWGDNASGQLGTNDTVNRSAPVQIGTSSWTAVSSDSNQANFSSGFTAAIRSDGALFTWGYNFYGSLGNNNNVYQSSPIQIGTSSWIAVNACNTMLALRSDNTLWNWGGFNSGLTIPTPFTSSPVQIGTNSNWTTIAVTAAFNSSGFPAFAAINSNKQLFVWGDNTFGQIGNNTTVSSSSPIQISGSWNSISGGAGQFLALRSDNTLWSWGQNTNGQLGDTTATNRSSPVQIGTSSWSVIAAGCSYSMALRLDRGLFTWGANALGQLGAGTVASRLSPVQVGTSSWISIGTNTQGAAAIKIDKTLWKWGAGYAATVTASQTNYSSPIQIGTSSWTAITAGPSYMTAIRSDRTLWAWGDNTYGQLGSGLSPVFTVALSSPTQVGAQVGLIPLSTVYSWTVINSSSNSLHTTAIRSDGALFVWGSNPSGQLGNNNLFTTSSPVQIGTSSWVTVAASTNNTAAIRKDNALFLWGANTNGQLANAGYSLAATYTSTSSPVQIGGPLDFGSSTVGSPPALSNSTLTSWSIISANTSVTMAIRTSDSSLWAWGLNTNGQLGTGDVVTYSSPVQIGTSSWTTVTAGATNGTAIRSDGALFTWGLGTSGQLGDNTILSKSSPVQIGTSSWVSVATGQTHVVALRSDNTLFAWGLNTSGQLGDGTIVSKSSPVAIGTSSWTSVAAGAAYTSAVRSDGGLFAWGLNAYGQLGQNSIANASSPVQIGTSSWTSVSTGPDNTIALLADKTLWGWGNPANGSIANAGFGVGTALVSVSSPVQIGIGQSWTAVTVSDGKWNLALRADGALFVWGTNNFYGQQGTNNVVANNSPVQIGTSSWIAIGAGYYTSGAIRSDGAIFVWGRNNVGALGQSDIVDRSSPVQIGTSSWTAINFAAGNTMYAIRSGGSLYAWGDNQVGAIGDNTIVNKSSPVQIGTSSWTAINGGAHALALRSDGGLFTWGYGGYGSLGRSTIVNASSPIQVGTSSWSSIGGGTYNSAAIRTDGALFTWGLNNQGALGDGTIVNKSSPIQIGTSSWSAVRLNYRTPIALRTDKALFTWGANLGGGIGDNTIVNKSSPVQIGTSSWTSIASHIGYASGSDGNGAILPNGALYVWGGSIVPAPAANAGASSPVQIGTSSYNVISTQGYTTAAIRTDGALYTWGLGTTGQLGNNAITIQSSPVVIGTSSWTSVAMGGIHSVALRSGNTMFTWGGAPAAVQTVTQNAGNSSPVQINSSSYVAVAMNFDTLATVRSDGGLFTWGLGTTGQLGNNAIVNASSPVQIGTSSWSAVKIGASFVTAIRSDKTLWAWGANTYGTTGQNTIANASSPVQIGTSSWSAIAAGAYHVAAVRADGGLWGWGRNNNNQLASTLSPATYTSCSSPNQVGYSININPSSIKQWTTLATINTNGTNHVGAIDTNGYLWMWGNNNFGQLGTNDVVLRSSPIQIGTSSWIVVSTGTSATAAIRSDGGLFTWGVALSGRLANNSIVTNVSSPVQIGTSSWTAVRVGTGYMLALRSDNTLWTWGIQQYQNSFYSPSTFIAYGNSPIQLGVGSTFAKIATAAESAAAIDSAGALYIWGTGLYFGLTFANGQYYQQPFGNFKLSANTGLSWTSCALPDYSIYALRSDGALFAWGAGSFGALSTGTTDRSSPIQIGGSWTSVTAGYLAGWATRSDGAVYAWGYNSNGQLGFNIVNNGVSTPTQLFAGSESVKSIIGGGQMAYAIKSDNTLYTWGTYDSGNLGQPQNLSLTAWSSPIQIGTSSWTSVAAGQYHTLALNSNSNLYGFGLNATGQIGNSSITIVPSPVQIGTSSWTAITAGASHSAAIRYNDKALFTWGGGIADIQHYTTGLQTAWSSPIQIGAGSWNSVTAGNNFTIAVSGNNTLYAWGQNTIGQIPVYTATSGYVNASLPVQVGTSSWVAVGAGTSFTTAIL